jgi:ASC-1-like (ASCH) protein
VNTHSLRIRDPFLQMILAGRKTVEVRVQSPRLESIAVGDEILFNGLARVRVAAVRRYATFAQLAMKESPSAINPDINPADMLIQLQQLYPPDAEALGVLAIELAETSDDPC